jgi:hypothetical protein
MSNHKLILQLDTKDRRASDNRRLAQWRVKWLIEHSTSLSCPEIGLHIYNVKSVNYEKQKRGN